MDERIVYLNGSFVPESEAKVSVLDSGFNAGDGVYDVTRTFRHKPFKLREHTERLFRSLHYTRIDCGMSLEQMEKTTLEVLERNKPFLRDSEDCALWQVISRGVRSSTGNRVSGGATVAIYSVSVNFREFASFYVEGAPLIIPSTRRIPPQCLESKAKITNKMNHNIAAFEAKQADPRAIPLMLDIDGNLSETSAHNFFLVIAGKLCTPSDKNVLGGITKETIFDLAKQLGVEVGGGISREHQPHFRSGQDGQRGEDRQRSTGSGYASLDRRLEQNGRYGHCRSGFEPSRQRRTRSAAEFVAEQEGGVEGQCVNSEDTIHLAVCASVMPIGKSHNPFRKFCLSGLDDA